ncbi:MAG: hypothetical protein PVF49_08735 [Anaerolineales bacterium]|jgi:hypothetical protein
MRSKWVKILVGLLFYAVLSACGGPPAPTCDATDLVAPNLMMPADGGTLELGQGLDWGYPASPCEPGGYNLQVNTASDFSGTEVGGFVPPPHSWWWPSTPLDQGTTYYWRVQAVLDGDPGPWSPTWSFNTKPACQLADLVAPSQIFPEDNAEITYSLPSVVWDYTDPACDPLGYHLQIANDPGFDFTSIAYERRDPDPTTSDPNAGATLADCEIYYWRVAAYDGTTDGPFSPTRTFRLNISGTCPIPTCAELDLVAPEHVWPGPYEHITTLDPYLQWDYPDLCQPEGYLVNISTTYDMSDIVFAGGTTDPSTSTSPTNPLEPATEYWWEVIPGVGPTLGPSSGTQSFFTGPECTSSAMLGAPELLSPANGEQVQSLSAVLHYSPSIFGCVPDGYVADLQTDSSFSGTNLLTTYMLPGTTIITDELVDCTTYYWRIAAIHQDGTTGPYSATGNFYVNASGTCIGPPQASLILEALRDWPCYQGPSFDAAIQGYFLTGEVAPLIAQGLMGEWWVIENPDALDETCWVPQEGTEPSGDTESLPRWAASEPLVCTRDLDRSACEAAGGTYVEPSRVANDDYCQCP